MKLLRAAVRSISDGFYHQFNRPLVVRSLSTSSIFDSGNNENQNVESAESADDFERRIFGGLSADSSSSFFRKLDRVERRGRDGFGMNSNSDNILDGFDMGINTLTDGMEGDLKKAAAYFEFNEAEVLEDDYTFRPDMNLKPRMTYTPEDLNLRKPGVWKPSKQPEFEVTTEEVLRKADFRNVQFLANFITEAGIMHKRSKTGISAKAQRKVAREIKTARAFGLLPFTTMGTKAFVYGKTMENLDEDFEAEHYADDIRDPLGV